MHAACKCSNLSKHQNLFLPILCLHRLLLESHKTKTQTSPYGMVPIYLKMNVSLTAPSSKSRIGSRAPTGQEFSVLRQHVPLCPQAV